MSFKVSIIIATYNRFNDLKECLSSVFRLKTKPHEVIIVDSNSTDGTRTLKDYFPAKFVFTSKRNRQYARNLGISTTTGDIVAFLDDDVVVQKEWLNEIVKPYVDKSVGGVGGRVIPYGKSAKFYLKISKCDVGKVYSNGLVIGNFDVPSQNLLEVDSLLGCNMSFRRELLLKLKGFDENYAGTGYRDDTDMCIRIRKLGYKILYNPKALIWHKFKGKQVGGVWSYWYIRNNVYFYLKNFYAQYKLSFPIFLYRLFMPPRDYILKSGVKVKIEPTLFLNTFKGFINGFKTWQKHARIMYSDVTG
ncbi:MAG: glycosyltransferase family 2 protein [Candidatus Bathyarchaeia archaeon]